MKSVLISIPLCLMATIAFATPVKNVKVIHESTSYSRQPVSWQANRQAETREVNATNSSARDQATLDALKKGRDQVPESTG